MVHLRYITCRLAVHFIILSVLQNVESSLIGGPIVQTTVGVVKGIRDENYSMFLGIPYASVDKDIPFGVSQAYPKFETVFEANDDAYECPQTPDGEDSPVGTLDCLRLNIYVPNSAYAGNSLPVLVWIHGGAFATGSGKKDEFGPKFLIRHDIILVTFNYRLGIYGFMCLNHPKVPGNQGLKDQLSALRWIKQNIAAFGGDVDKITLSGGSSGSASVALHLLSDEEKLFSQAILQSGTSLVPWATTDAVYKRPIALAMHMGFDTGNVSDKIDVALEYLAQQKPDNIIRAVFEMGLQFAPCIEKEFDGVEPFLKDDPEKLDLKNKDMPILIGSNDDEMLYMFAHEDMEKLGDIFYQTLEVSYDLDKKDLEKIVEISRHFYIGDKEITNDVKREAIDFESDISFFYPTEKSIKKYNRQGAKVYRYMFSYIGARNYLRDHYNLTFGGASHAEELGYLFDMKMLDQKPNLQDQLMIDRITTLWANFVKHGDPTFGGISELLPVSWPPVTAKEMPYLVLDSELSVKNRPFNSRMAFWDLFDEYLKLTKKDGGNERFTQPLNCINRDQSWENVTFIQCLPSGK